MASQDRLTEGCIICAWELCAVYPHPDKFGDHRHSESGDIMILIFHMTLRDHILGNMAQYGFMDGISSPVGIGCPSDVQ